MSLLILASITTLFVIIFATLAYVINVKKIGSMQTDYDSKMQSIVDQVNKSDYKVNQLDTSQSILLDKNRQNIITTEKIQAEDNLKLNSSLISFQKDYTSKMANLNNTDTILESNLSNTTTNLLNLTTFVNNMPIDKQTKDILTIQNSNIIYGERFASINMSNIQFTNNINNINSKYASFSNITNNALLNNNQKLASLSNYNISQDIKQASLSNYLYQVDGSLKTLSDSYQSFSNNTTSWMNNVDIAMKPQLQRIANNYVSLSNFNSTTNITTSNINRIDSNITYSLPQKYASSSLMNTLNTITIPNVTSEIQLLQANYSNIVNNYATKQNVLNAQLATVKDETALKSIEYTMAADSNNFMNSILNINQQISSLDTKYPLLTNFNNLSNSVTNLKNSVSYTLNNGIDITSVNPGPLIQKKISTASNNRYGIVQTNNSIKMFSPNYAANNQSYASMSFANIDGTYTDILKVKPNGSTSIQNGSLQIYNGNTVTLNADNLGNITTKGTLTVNNIQLPVGSKICIGTKCISASNL